MAHPTKASGLQRIAARRPGGARRVLRGRVFRSPVVEVAGGGEPIPHVIRGRLTQRRRPRIRGCVLKRGKSRHRWDLRGKYRVFNTAAYRFYRSNSGPPVESDTPFATNASLPHEPADVYGNGTWYLSVSYFNGVIDSGFLPIGPAGETYLRLDLAAGVETTSPPRGPLDWRLENRQAVSGVAPVRVHGVYFQTGAERAEEWAIAWTTDGSDPPADTPGATVEIPAVGSLMSVLQYTIAAFGEVDFKVRLQTRRNDSGWVYSENSEILTITSDATGPSVPLAGEASARFNLDGGPG